MTYLYNIVEQRYNIEWAKRVDFNSLGFTLFFGHGMSADGKLTKTCLSQWWLCDFTVDGIKYNCMEQFMMAGKAALFDDTKILTEIMHSKDQKYIKSLGRKIKGFDSTVWNKHKFSIVYQGNLAKFSQNEDLKQFLISTKDTILAEASPYDAIWGIKLSENERKAYNPNTWNGENLLGFALMQVRDEVRK